MRTTALVIAGGVLAAASFGVWSMAIGWLVDRRVAPIEADLRRTKIQLEMIESAVAIALQLAARNAEAGEAGELTESE